MIDPGAGYSLIGLWGLLMIGIAYFIFRRQNVVDTKEFITGPVIFWVSPNTSALSGFQVFGCTPDLLYCLRLL
jgi:hypothetical protein